MKKNTLLLLLLSLWCLALQAQNPPAAVPQKSPIVLKNGFLHLGNGQVIENGSLRFENGLISEIGSGSVSEGGAEVIDLQGSHVYPGLILPYSTLGLTEISAVRASNDFYETGDYNPNIRALIGYNTDSEIIPTTRSNGVLLVQTTPRGGVLPGTSSIMELDGWNWEDAVLKADEGIHLNWIGAFRRNWDGVDASQKNKEKEAELQKLHSFFQEAKAYYETEKPQSINVKLEAMEGLFDGSKTLFIRAELSREIAESVLFAKKYQIQKIVIVGGAEALQVSDLLLEHQVPVILERLHRLPSTADDDVFLPYKLPYLLTQKGILTALSYDNEEPMGSRNLPFLAGTAAAYGLDKEEALMTVSYNTARILGIDDKTGSLETGKHATLCVSTGDLLDMRTNQVSLAFIQGKKIDLDDKQKRLYSIYKEKYGK